MTDGQIWKYTDLIKTGSVSYKVGDVVNIFRRKKNGHPRGIKDNKDYFIVRLENDNLEVSRKIDETDGNKLIKVHKTFMIPKVMLREIKINSILQETN